MTHFDIPIHTVFSFFLNILMFDSHNVLAGDGVFSIPHERRCQSRMDAIIYFLFACAVSLTTAKEHASSASTDYIERRLREAKVEIAKVYSDDQQSMTKTYDVQWERSWSRALDTSHAMTMNIFNETYLLANHWLTHIEMDSPLNLTEEKVASIHEENTVKFIRNISWKGKLYLLICLDGGFCSLYTGNSDLQLRYWQTIRHRGIPMDAAFFTHENQLHLVVADNTGQFSVPSVIYHWTGTYMDVMSEVMTTGAVSVTTFNHKNSVIIVFLQNVPSNPRIGSEVYKFKNGNIERIQFITTDAPVSVHHYTHDGKMFLLIANEIEPSNVYWWDGKEFLNWMDLPDVRSPTTVDIIQADKNTLFFVSNMNSVTLYKIMNLNCEKLDHLELKDRVMIDDITVKVDDTSIMLVMITRSSDNVCHVEPIEVHIEEISREGTVEVADPAMQCLTELKSLLNDRMPLILEAHNSWPLLFPFSENVTVDQPIYFPNLIMEAGSISNVDVLAPEGILTPKEMKSGLERAALEVDAILSASQEVLQLNDSIFLTGEVLIEEDAFFDELNIDSFDVNYLNDVEVEWNNVLSYAKEQQFLEPLRGEYISVDWLEVNSLCGIPFENWQIRTFPWKTTLDLAADGVQITNDTILVYSDLFLQDFWVTTLNNLDTKTFLNDLFLIGRNQIIKGNIYHGGLLQVSNLTVQSLNGVPSEKLITKMTEQELGNVFIKTLEVENLTADTINGVPVNETARTTQENVIKGEVTLRSLRVTESFVSDSDIKLPPIHPVQMYDDVKIMGDVTIKNLQLKSKASLLLNGGAFDLNHLFDDFWTKSTDQNITRDVILENGMTIDELNTKHLNGLAEDDFLYTTAVEIPEQIRGLNFAKFKAGGTVSAEGRVPTGTVIVEDSLVVNEELRIDLLAVQSLVASTYNRIPIEDILKEQIGLYVSGTTKFETVRVKELTAGEVSLTTLNDRRLENFFQRAMYTDRNYSIANLLMPLVEATDFNVDKLNGFKVDDFMTMLRRIRDMSVVEYLTVDGDLKVRGNMQVEFINEMETMQYFGSLSEAVMIVEGQRVFRNFTVFGNLTVDLLEGTEVEVLAANTLSRTRAQNISGQFRFDDVSASSLQAKLMNECDLGEIRSVSDALTFEGDVNFSDLYVRGNVVTELLNSFDVAELYENALTILTTQFDNLTINGSMSWEIQASELKSISYLYENAVTKNTNQFIRQETIFENNILAFSVNATDNINGIDIAQIVSDAVIPKNEPTLVRGRKTFKQGLTVGNLTVSGDIGIPIVNSWNIVDLNSSVVRKSQNETVTGRTVFAREVFVQRLLVDGNVHGMPPRGLVTTLAGTIHVFPSPMHFRYLEVSGNIYTDSLDGLNFLEFMDNRITLDGNHDVYADSLFHGQVVVTDASVLSINNTVPSDFVVSGNNELQVISGAKEFSQSLIVDGHVVIPLINDINVMNEYQNGIVNDEDVEIYGDIIFEASVETHSGITVSGHINEMDLDRISVDVRIQESLFLQALRQNETSIEEMISYSLMASQDLQNVFMYFEAEEDLVIQAPNIHYVIPVNVESMTKLNLYGFDPGASCGLPDFCPCPVQYVAEILSDNCEIWKMNGSERIFNFHEPNGVFGVNIVTETVSSSAQCTTGNPDTAFTSISWMTPAKSIAGGLAANVREKRIRMSGYLSDVKVFTRNGKVFFVLAIYYDPVRASHDVNSLVYELDPATEEITLCQTIPTNGAWVLEVFRAIDDAVYILIGCTQFPSETQLYRFNDNLSQFEILRTFPTGGSSNVKSLIQEKESFVLMDDPLTKSVHIFKHEFDNFYFYQSLFHESCVNNIEVFYAGEYRYSDAHVLVTTDDGQFFVYEYMFLGGFQLKIRQSLDGVQSMVPFYFSKKRYVFVGTNKNSTILRMVEQGPH